MKHRSVGTFIILAALFVAVPQASSDLLNLACDAGARARTELLRAFLGLQSGGSVTAFAGETSPQIASRQTNVAEERRASRKQAQDSGRAPSAATSRIERPDAGALELAMILDSPVEGQPAPPSADFVRRLESSEIMRPHALDAKKLKELSELAMIIPPSASIPPVAAVVKSERLKADTARAVQETAQNKFIVAASLAGKTVRINAEEIRREVCAAVGKESGAAAGAAKGGARAGASSKAGEVKVSAESTPCGAPLFVKVATLAPTVPPAAPTYYFTASE